MCIMEVRPGQHRSTMAQAMAHNLSTVDRDFDMLVALMQARGDHEGADAARRVQSTTHAAYAAALSLWKDEVAQAGADFVDYEHHHGDGTTEHDHAGNERTLESIAMRDRREARKYETR